MLSDDSSRRAYDRTGHLPGQQQRAREQRQESSSGWNFNFGFGGRNKKQHRYLFERGRREHIRDAQSRVIHIRSMQQLKAVIVEDDHQLTTERYALLSFFDSSFSECENRQNNEILFPWPFAGYNYEGAQSGMWWEEIMLSGVVDIADRDTQALEIVKKFGVNIMKTGCPTIVMIPRGVSINDISGKHSVLIAPKSAEQFMQWVWPQLKMNVLLENQTPYNIQLYWLDGARGKDQALIPAGGSYTIDTFISHSFYGRASFVKGNILTNEVFRIHNLSAFTFLMTYCDIG